MQDRLTIGGFSRLTGLTPKALRHYDTLGLLRPAAVEPNGYRVYDRAQIPAGRLIRRLRDLDVPLEDIRAVLDDPTRRRNGSRAMRERSRPTCSGASASCISCGT